MALTAVQAEILRAAEQLLDDLPPAQFFPSLLSVAEASGIGPGPLAAALSPKGRPGLVTLFANVETMHTKAAEEADSRILNRIEYLGELSQELGPEATLAQIGDFAGRHMLDLFEDAAGYRRELILAAAAVSKDGARPRAKTDEARQRRAFQDMFAGYYEDLRVNYSAMYVILLEGWKRSIRPGWTMESLATVLTALAEGLLLRGLTDPSFDRRDGATMFGQTVQMIIACASGPVGDQRPLADQLNAIL